MSGPARTATWDRDAARGRLEREAFDLVVVGGGVTGAGVARDAVRRGLAVALVEAADWAQGASSRTTKFAHGGLRYLELLDFGLVRTALAERAVLLSIAPHLTCAVPFLIPLYAGRGRPTWKLELGLKLYDLLAGTTRLGRHQVLDRVAAREREPLLSAAGLAGAGVYWDARVRDARLVVETVASARRAGAVVATRCRVGAVEPWGGGWVGEVEDGVDGSRFQLRGSAWVNATGPWADRLRARAAPGRPPLLRPTKGVHVVVPRERLPLRDATTLFAPDGRLVFAVPEGIWTYVGTTDTPDGGDVDALGVDPADTGYLVDAVRSGLEAGLGPADVVGAWAGWRPLVRPTRPRSPSDVSREDVVEATAPGLWTVTGGKLTTYRRMAEAAVDRVVEARGWDVPACDTAAEPLVPPRVGGGGPPVGAPPSAVARVRGLFGPDADDVFARWRAEPATAERLPGELPFTAAEVERAAREMVGSLDDLVDRRLLALPGGTPVDDTALEAIARAAAPVLGWDEARIAAEVAGFRGAAAPAG